MSDLKPGPSRTPVWIEAGCAIALVIITGTYTFYARGQLREMRKSTDAAQNAANTARDALRLAYRPRITLQNLFTQNNALDRGKLALNVQVLNYGPILARNVKVFRYENLSARDAASRLPYKTELKDYSKTLPASNTPVGWGIYGDKTLTEQEIKDLGRKKLIATFSVLVTYEDDFSLVHHSEACIMFTLPPNQYWIPCPWDVQND